MLSKRKEEDMEEKEAEKQNECYIDFMLEKHKNLIKLIDRKVSWKSEKYVQS